MMLTSRYTEPFHCRLRDEVLEREEVETVADAREGGVVPPRVQHGPAAQLVGLCDAEGVRCHLRQKAMRENESN
jgi:hypothetical protein